MKKKANWKMHAICYIILLGFLLPSVACAFDDSKRISLANRDDNHTVEVTDRHVWQRTNGNVFIRSVYNLIMAGFFNKLNSVGADHLTHPDFSTESPKHATITDTEGVALI